ncbi:FG-GAP-like repeat-containing protein [Streptomyces sp. NPDC017529]|uniref:C40 family peptidase n=1 Tax=Streptomyces sp. NPDC017529 TaxID=3365000 RepID=UPI0037A535BD
MKLSGIARRCTLTVIATTALALGPVVTTAPVASADTSPTAPDTRQDHGGGGQGAVTPVPQKEVRGLVAAAASAEASLTRGEALERAASWVDQGLKYNWGGSYQGYRTDCSGYVSMAWGLDRSETTDTLVPTGLAKWISKGDLKPGDALLNDATLASGHVVLFAKWTDASQDTYWGYEFTPSGVHYRQIPYPYFSGHGTFKPIRYVNIQDGATAAGTHDATGDGKADLLALEKDGTITLAEGTGNGFANYHNVTKGFGAYLDDDRLKYADVTGDGKADLLALEKDGTITLAEGTGNGFTNYHTISKGFGEYVNDSRLQFADVTGDGKADLLALEKDGTITLAEGTGNGFAKYHTITKGFGAYLKDNRLKFADVTGDGKADLLALEKDGTITLGRGFGNGFTDYHTISKGFGGYVNDDRLQYADVTGDGKADLLALEKDGTITLAEGTGDGFANYHAISKGFGSYVDNHRLKFAG